jgi:alpha-glucosidase
VEAEDGVDGSTLELYRRTLRIRAERLAGEGSFEWVDTGPGTLGFKRGNLMVVVNFGPGTVPIPEGELLLSSSAVEEGLVTADTAVWLDTDTMHRRR